MLNKETEAVVELNPRIAALGKKVAELKAKQGTKKQQADMQRKINRLRHEGDRTAKGETRHK